MLKGISHLIGPDLLRMLHQMGHGDRLTLADAHFPGHSLGPQVVRADGLKIVPLLAAILALLHLEESRPLTLMEFDADFVGDPDIEADYVQVAETFQPGLRSPLRLQRREFYDIARTSFAIVMTGDTRPYGNVILTKGVTPRSDL